MLGKEEGGAAAARSRLANLRTCDPHSLWRLSLVVFRAFTYVTWCLAIHPLRFGGRKHKGKSVIKQEKRTAKPMVENYLSRITFDLQDQIFCHTLFRIHKCTGVLGGWQV